MKRILMIDDEQPILDVVDTILSDMGFDVTTHSDPESGIAVALEQDFDLILLDIRMPKANGAEVTRRIMARKPASRILLLTGHPGDPLARKALDAGARAIVRKPFEIAKILKYVDE